MSEVDNNPAKKKSEKIFIYISEVNSYQRTGFLKNISAFPRPFLQNVYL
jgi:hypothetical protein